MITDLLTQAQQLGIQIYIDNGQVKITLPWPLESTPEPARGVLGELRRRQAEVLTALDPDQQKYWEALLDNTYHLLDPQRQPMRELHEILKKLKSLGATLTRQGNTLQLSQGQMPWADWNKCQYDMINYYGQLDWVLRLSLLGAAREYVDLASECPKEWIDELLGKHGARIASLRAELMGRERCFEMSDGRRYWLVPCKTGQVRTEITPEEFVIIAEAQDSGMLPAGQGGAWTWIKETT